MEELISPRRNRERRRQCLSRTQKVADKFAKGLSYVQSPPKSSIQANSKVNSRVERGDGEKVDYDQIGKGSRYHHSILRASRRLLKVIRNSLSIYKIAFACSSFRNPKTWGKMRVLFGALRQEAILPSDSSYLQVLLLSSRPGEMFMTHEDFARDPHQTPTPQPIVTLQSLREDKCPEASLTVKMFRRSLWESHTEQRDYFRCKRSQY